MRISVIIPTYNRAYFILDTIKSIQNQTIKPNEIIVVDDGSTDNTKELLEELDITYIYQENQGVSSARNTAIKIASNPWLAFCDSDDIWHNNKLEKQMEYHQQNPDILVSHTDETWKFNDKIIKKKAYHKKPSGDCFIDNLDSCKIGASTLLINKSILEDVGVFDTNLVACEDYDLWLRILDKYKLGLCNEELITKIAGHKGQLSFETPLMDTFRIEALQKHLTGKFKDEVTQELIKKIQIVLKGATKHNNSKILKKYTTALENLKI